MEHNQKPLTMEQLRKMGRQPVYVDILDAGKTFIRFPGWCKIEIEDAGTDDEYANVWWPGSEVGDIGRTQDYGKTWLAYACKPVDFEEWKPCAKCRSCFSCAHVVESINDSKHACFWCEHMDKFKPMNFCSNCGRPLTQDARALLEKRIMEG